MQPGTKKIGELLLDAGLLTMPQLQDALRQQRISGGRMGSNLVALGYIDEETLLDFLAQKTGVLRLDTRALEIPRDILMRIPKRMAEQFCILPVASKEPKTLVLAMADPSDLNAIDSARFASGFNIDPMVAAHSTIMHLIATHYRAQEEHDAKPAASGGASEALPVSLNLGVLPDAKSTGGFNLSQRQYGKDPFFDKAQPASPTPFFSTDPLEFVNMPIRDPRLTPEQPMVIPARGAKSPAVRQLETLPTRTLVLGLIRLLQRRSVVGDDELQRFIHNLLESGELPESDREAD